MDIKKIQGLFRTDASIEGWNQQAPYTLEQSKSRYADWQNHAKAHDLQPMEHLLPRIYCPCPAELPAFMLQADNIKPDDQLIQQRDELGPWGFWFKLAPDITTKNLDIIGCNRITCRSHLITSTVEKL